MRVRNAEGFISFTTPKILYLLEVVSLPINKWPILKLIPGQYTGVGDG